MLSANGVTVRFGKRVLFEDVNIKFGKGNCYGIMEEVDGKSQLTESNTVQRSDMAGNGDESRYSMLNDIAISKTMQDYETLNEMLEEYYKKNYLVDCLFDK